MSLQQKLEWFQDRRQEIEAEAGRNGGKVRRQDLWRRNYFKLPYMARMTPEQFFNRVCDLVHNQVELDEQGRISLAPMMHNDAWIMQRWAHVMEEASARGGFLDEMIASSMEPLKKYFENGQPRGVKLFEGLNGKHGQALVKYSRREFIERMHRLGEIRIAPASTFSDGSLLSAQRDFEVLREFIIPTAEMYIKGFRHAEIEGVTYDISSSDVEIVEEMKDYFVYCLCREVDRRLPTDFKADAALVIHDRRAFQLRFFDALRERLRGWDMQNGEVTYFDPYTDYRRNKVLEITKHFRFHYQKEFRLLARPKRKLTHDLEPFFITLGSLEGFSTPFYGE